MTSTLSDPDLAEISAEQKRALVAQRLQGLQVTLASGLLDVAQITGLEGSEGEVDRAAIAIKSLRHAVAVHREELAALAEEA